MRYIPGDANVRVGRREDGALGGQKQARPENLDTERIVVLLVNCGPISVHHSG